MMIAMVIPLSNPLKNHLKVIFQFLKCQKVYIAFLNFVSTIIMFYLWLYSIKMLLCHAVAESVNIYQVAF